MSMEFDRPIVDIIKDIESIDTEEGKLFAEMLFAVVSSQYGAQYWDDANTRTAAAHIHLANLLRDAKPVKPRYPCSKCRSFEQVDGTIYCSKCLTLMRDQAEGKPPVPHHQKTQ